MVGVVSHQSRQMERNGKSGLSLAEQVVISGIRIFRSAEPAELTHGPQPAAIHCGIDSACIWWFTGFAGTRNRAGVEFIDRHAGNRRECSLFNVFAHRPLCIDYSRSDWLNWGQTAEFD